MSTRAAASYELPRLRVPFALPALSTERLRLRPLTEEDEADVAAYQSRDDVVRYLPWPLRDRAASAQHTRERATLTSIAKTGDRAVLAIVTPAGVGRSRVIGELTLIAASVPDAQLEIGWVLHPEFQGAGYASEAAGALLHLCFEQFGAHRVSAGSTRATRHPPLYASGSGCTARRSFATTSSSRASGATRRSTRSLPRSGSRATRGTDSPAARATPTRRAQAPRRRSAR